MRHRPDGTAHRAMAWAARRAQTGAGAEARRGVAAVVMAYMKAPGTAVPLRPLRRTLSAQRRRGHVLREDLTDRAVTRPTAP
ncbi:hypothetical protein GCM10010431_63970 [Streptomyces kunmingensis]